MGRQRGLGHCPCVGGGDGSQPMPATSPNWLPVPWRLLLADGQGCLCGSWSVFSQQIEATVSFMRGKRGREDLSPAKKNYVFFVSRNHYVRVSLTSGRESVRSPREPPLRNLFLRGAGLCPKSPKNAGSAPHQTFWDECFCMGPKTEILDDGNLLHKPERQWCGCWWVSSPRRCLWGGGMRSWGQKRVSGPDDHPKSMAHAPLAAGQDFVAGGIPAAVAKLQVCFPVCVVLLCQQVLK